jgi:hypothetical protein
MGTAWDTQIVDSNSSLNAGPIALDSNGTPHIAYLGKLAAPTIYNAYIKYATATESTQPVAPIPTTEIYLLIAAPVLIVTVLIALIYLWKKKTREKEALHTYAQLKS